MNKTRVLRGAPEFQTSSLSVAARLVLLDIATTMAHIVAFVWLMFAARWALALDHAVAQGPYLVNNETQGAITMNGIWYSLSNSTTDTNAMDPLKDAEACTRDAALMSQLGINTIYVMTIDPKVNHDDCFSIFNSVGIYVILELRKDGIFMTSYDDFVDSYTTDMLENMFGMIDAVKDYENLLGFDLGIIPNMGQFVLEGAETSYSDAEKQYRAFIRDTKEYIAYNAPRAILVGGALHLTRNDELLSASDLTNSHVYWLSCSKNERDSSNDDFSRADYVSFFNLGYFETELVEKQNSTYASLASAIDNATIPTWLSMYGVSDEADYVEYELRPELLDDTLYLYNSSSQLIRPNGGPLTGGARFSWTNANLGWKVPQSNWGLVRTDPDGTVHLTPNFDRLREIFSQMNSGTWLSGSTVSLGPGMKAPQCDKDDMVNTTTEFFFDERTTVTIATDWELPTRPAGLDAMITSGVNGKRGQMVDVTVTTIVQTVRDSGGNVVTDVTLEPSKSEARSTTGAGASIETGTLPSTSSDASILTTGAKAGIGVGVGIGVLALASAAGFLLLQRRKNRTLAETTGDSTKNGSGQSSDGSEAFGGLRKAELAAGPDVETQQAELPAGDGSKALHEAPSQESGAGVFELNAAEHPVELPVAEQRLELPTQNHQQ